jgi:hypothetical protein
MMETPKPFALHRQRGQPTSEAADRKYSTFIASSCIRRCSGVTLLLAKRAQNLPPDPCA